MVVDLVSMPYADLQRPSPALGILKAVLGERDVRVRCHYANLLFCEHIGLKDWTAVASVVPQDCLGDWTFSHVAFPEHRVAPDRFAAMLEKRRWAYRGERLVHTMRRLERVREAAAIFLKDMVRHILSAEPRVVACSSMFAQHVSSLALLRLIKDQAPEVVTMMGGANCEGIMGVTTHRVFPWVDYVVCGEADGVIADLIETTTRSRKDGAAAGDRARAAAGRGQCVDALPTGVLGPIHRQRGYPVDANAAQLPPHMDLDGLPLPHYDEFFETLERCPSLCDRVEPALPIETSRGCWWGRCTFCGLNGAYRPYRSKHPYLVLEQMDALHRRYGVHRLEVIDNVFDTAYFETLLPELERRGSPYLIFWATRSNLTRRQVELLRDAGVTWIQPGIESLHSEHLALMKKGRRAWEHVQLLKFSSDSGLLLLWLVLNGFPGEKDIWFAEMSRLLPLLTHLQPPQVLSPITFTRFSHYHRHPEDYGLCLTAPDPYAHVYPLAADDVDQLVYFFEDRAFDRQRRAREGMAVIAGERSGIAAFRHELAQWMAAFRNGPRPILSLERIREGLRIVDTRPAAVDSEHLLTGLAARIYEVCDEAPTPRALRAALGRELRNHEDVEADLERLVEKRLVARVDDRLIALATRHPTRPLPASTEAPCGLIT